MKEDEFVRKHPKESIEVPIYFRLDDDGNVIIDDEGITDEFGDKLKQILEEAELEEDELREMVKEKMEKIKDEKNNKNKRKNP